MTAERSRATAEEFTAFRPSPLSPLTRRSGQVRCQAKASTSGLTGGASVRLTPAPGLAGEHQGEEHEERSAGDQCTCEGAAPHGQRSARRSGGARRRGLACRSPWSPPARAIAQAVTRQPHGRLHALLGQVKRRSAPADRGAYPGFRKVHVKTGMIRSQRRKRKPISPSLSCDRLGRAGCGRVRSRARRWTRHPADGHGVPLGGPASKIGFPPTGILHQPGAGGCRFMANVMTEYYGRASEQNQVWIVNRTAELESAAALLD